MKKIKVFVLPSHATSERVSGVDFVRVIQPMEHLNGWKDDEVEFETYVYDVIKDKTLDWIKVVTDYDIVYFNYTANPWAFAAMGAMCQKTNTPMIMDLDDGIWEISEDNPAYRVYAKGSDGIKVFTDIVNAVDYVTCTNSYLKNVIVHNSRKTHDKIKVFKNYIDFNLYRYIPEFKNTNEIILTHFGSTTHFNDLQNKEFVEGIDMIMKEYPNVKFLTLGSFIPEFREKWGQRYLDEFGHMDLYKWVNERFPEVMAKTDICVVPLTNNIYNRCKSDIKFLEMSSAKKPGVWQDIRQYQEIVDGKNGLLATRAKDWYDKIKYLIDNPEVRKEMGENAYETVKRSHQMKDNIDSYAQFFKEVDRKFSKE